ncbi:MAG TPA: hypothetical protein O0X27_03440 [Methanocorpusculum sp.]|nr:hypothetical protein [Methanocorpusculum sp.]
MITIKKAGRKLVPLCLGILLLILCGAGIGTVAALNEISLGDVYLNALYENRGSVPIAGNEYGWTNALTGNSVSFTQEDATHYYISDRASSAATSSLAGTYGKTIGDTRYRIDVKYPSVLVSGYMYLKGDFSTPIGMLIGNTATTAYNIKLSVPATLGGTCKVTGIALTNPDGSFTQIVGTRVGNTIEFKDSLAGYDLGVWTATPVFQSGSANGFSNLAPPYMYGNAAHFTVKSADNSVTLTVSKATTPVPTRTPTAKPTAATPSPTVTPQTEDTITLPDDSVAEATPAYTEAPATSTQESPAPLAGLVLGLGAAAVLLRLRR